jgi:hypothetical protein
LKKNKYKIQKEISILECKNLKKEDLRDSHRLPVRDQKSFSTSVSKGKRRAQLENRAFPVYPELVL